MTTISQATLDAVETASERTADREPQTITTQILNVIAVLTPFIGVVLATIFLWGRGFSWRELGLMLSMYAISSLGVTIGYHRLFTHKAFETNRIMKTILAICGAMAIEGSIIKWVAMHRRHHQHSDREGDPHSPNVHEDGFFGTLKGLWHAHVGWIFLGDPRNLSRYVTDLLPDRLLNALSQLWTVWALVGLLIPTVLGGLLSHSWTGAWMGFIWGGLVRVFFVHNVTWSINSVCHLWGSRPYRSHDKSRNNVVFGVLGMGEGWHNNHHAFPTSARHGLSWWQFDASYLIIRGMELLGLAWNVRLPSATAMNLKRA